MHRAKTHLNKHDRALTHKHAHDILGDGDVRCRLRLVQSPLHEPLPGLFVLRDKLEESTGRRESPRALLLFHGGSGTNEELEIVVRKAEFYCCKLLFVVANTPCLVKIYK